MIGIKFYTRKALIYLKIVSRAGDIALFLIKIKSQNSRDMHQSVFNRPYLPIG